MLLEQSEPKYKMLGDDIVIMDRALAYKYLEVMTQLGVEISETKTHESKILFEFAKRFGFRGTEITQFPITALIENIRNYTLLSAVLSVTAPERGFVPLYIQSNAPSYLSSLMSIGFPIETRLRSHIIRKVQLISLLPSRLKPYLVNVNDLLKIGHVANIGELTFNQVNSALVRTYKLLKEREILKLTNLTAKWNFAVQNMLSSLLFTPV
jgi:hypothetical protein